MIPNILNMQEKFTISESTTRDLKLDQIIREFEEGEKNKSYEEVFTRPLTNRKEILFRQEIMRDFENKDFRNRIRIFARAIRELQGEVKKTEHIKNEQLKLMDCSHILQMAMRYCEVIEKLPLETEMYIRSEGMRNVICGIKKYISGVKFQNLKQEIQNLYERLNKINFCMLIKDGNFKIRPCENERSLEEEIQKVFSRFCDTYSEEQKKSQYKIRNAEHIDEAVLELLSRWYRTEFQSLKKFANEYREFVDPEILRFAQEAIFFIRWQDMIEPLKAKGMNFCYPEFREDDKISCEEGFDLALALELIKDDQKIVTNSFYLENDERIIVVSGPNQGGKTTFARFFGQTFYLSSLGCSVPGRKASVKCFDQIYTHFERDETENLSGGKLQDDIIRLHEILQHATKDSLLVINEIYSSTTLQDAVYLGKQMMKEITEKGCIAICVTFLDELSDLNTHIVSMMSTVEQKTRQRCYKIIRKPADGIADAMSLVQYYDLDYESLKRRMG